MPQKNGLKKSLLKIDYFLEFLLVPAVFSLIFVYASRLIDDLDIWLHLKAGELIFLNKSVPSTDPFSFTMQGKPWIDHEWLFQLISYFSFSCWGIDGLTYLKIVIIGTFFLFLYFIGHNFIRQKLETTVLLLITVLASLSRFNIRPEIFSMLFFCIYLYILEFHFKSRIIWLIIPLQVVWANLHGYFFLGPFLILIILAEKYFQPKTDLRYYRRLKIILFLAVLASFVNPYIERGAVYPIQILTGILSGKSEIFNYIEELKPVFLIKNPSFKFYYFLISLSLLTFICHFKKLKMKDVLLVTVFFLFGLIVRNIFFFAAVSFLFIAYYWGSALIKFKNGLLEQNSPRQTAFLFVRCLSAVLLLVYICFKINAEFNTYYFDFKKGEFTSSFFGLENNRYPQRAVDFLLANRIPARMFNDFNSGSYLIGRGYPKRQVFIDGRTELYGPEFYNQYVKAMEASILDLEKLIKKFGIEAVLLTEFSDRTSRLIKYLYKSPEWKMVFFDENGIIFLQMRTENKELISKHTINLDNYIAPPADLEKLGLRHIYPWPYIERICLLDILEKNNLVLQEAKEALRILPGCWQAYYYSGRAYLRQGKYKEAWESFRNAALSSRNKEIIVGLKKAKEHEGKAR